MNLYIYQTKLKKLDFIKIQLIITVILNLFIWNNLIVDKENYDNKIIGRFNVNLIVFACVYIYYYGCRYPQHNRE